MGTYNAKSRGSATLVPGSDTSDVLDEGNHTNDLCRTFTLVL